MTGTVERVARAICRSDADWEGNSWKQHEHEARAAIEATRVRQWRMWANFWCYIAVITTGTLLMVVL